MQKERRKIISITPFREGTESQLWEVFYSAIREVCSKDYTSEQVSAWAPDHFDPKVWHEKVNRIRPFQAWVDNTLAGYADIQADGLIDHFFVHANFQRLGVGNTLMQHLLNVGQNLPVIHSHVSITARPFYERFDFKVIQANRPVLRGVAFKNYLMERKTKK